MTRAKRRWLVVAILIAALTYLSVMWFLRDSHIPNQLRHKTITGVILSYQQTSEGLVFVIDDDATSSDKEILITESTLFADNSLEQSIFDAQTDLYVTVESEFWTKDYDGRYPAILISPAA